MKKMMLVAAAATFATTGLASAATYGNDERGTLTLQADAAPFCKITGVTSSDDLLDGPPTGSLGEGDAIATLDIQRDPNGTDPATANKIKADSVTIRMPASQCNFPFTASVRSDGFLTSNYTGDTPDDEFTLAVPFFTTVTFDGKELITDAVAGTTFADPEVPTFGTLRVTAKVKASNDRLVAGTYSGDVVFILNSF